MDGSGSGLDGNGGYSANPARTGESGTGTELEGDGGGAG